MKLVTVISPMYNVEEYTSSFLETLLSQSYQNLEIILVNDGSTDKTGSIIESYAKRDKRIRPIHQQNQGVSCARKTGMELANGYYTIQLDADDSFEPEMIEKLVHRAEDENADFTFCDYDIIYSDHKETITHQLDIIDRIHYMKAQLAYGMWGVYWNKLLRTELFRKHAITPIAGLQNWDDYVVINRCALHAQTFAYEQNVLYHYNRANVKSITYSIKRKSYEDILWAVSIITEAIEKSDLHKALHNELELLQLSQKDFLIFSQYRDFNKWRLLYRHADQQISALYHGIDKLVVTNIAQNHDLLALFFLLVRKLKKFKKNNE